LHFVLAYLLVTQLQQAAFVLLGIAYSVANMINMQMWYITRVLENP